MLRTLARAAGGMMSEYKYEMRVHGNPSEALSASLTVLYGSSNDNIPLDEMYLAEVIAFIQDNWGCLDDWEYTNRKPYCVPNRTVCSYCDEYHISPGCINRPA